MTYARKPDPLAVVSAPIKEFLTSNEPDASPGGGVEWKPITHQTLAAGFARSNLPGYSIAPGAGKSDLLRRGARRRKQLLRVRPISLPLDLPGVAQPRRTTVRPR